MQDPNPGSFELCPICWWEDDSVQFEDQDYEGGANEPSLRQARLNFSKHGAIRPEDKMHVRPPNDDEKPRG
jgi:hypothetical protein